MSGIFPCCVVYPEVTTYSLKSLCHNNIKSFWQDKKMLAAKSLDLEIKSLYELKPLRKRTIKTSNRLVS